MIASLASGESFSGKGVGEHSELRPPRSLSDSLLPPSTTSTKIKKILLRRGNEAEKELVCHDLKLQLLSRKVSRGGKGIELTAREYALLEYLMRNQGRVLTRTVIMEKIWAAQQHMETNLVDVYIRHLRSKIDEDFDDKLLETRRGYGYSIRAPVK